MLGFQSHIELLQAQHVINILLEIDLESQVYWKLSDAGVKTFSNFLDFASNRYAVHSLLVGEPCTCGKFTRMHALKLGTFSQVHQYASEIGINFDVARKFVTSIRDLSWSEYQGFIRHTLHLLPPLKNRSNRSFFPSKLVPAAPQEPRQLAPQLKILPPPKLPPLKADRKFNNAPWSDPIAPVVQGVFGAGVCKVLCTMGDQKVSMMGTQASMAGRVGFCILTTEDLNLVNILRLDALSPSYKCVKSRYVTGLTLRPMQQPPRPERTPKSATFWTPPIWQGIYPRQVHPRASGLHHCVCKVPIDGNAAYCQQVDYFHQDNGCRTNNEVPVSSVQAQQHAQTQKS